MDIRVSEDVKKEALLSPPAGSPSWLAIVSNRTRVLQSPDGLKR
jgi:hypothetical protein